jgi:hypothetical protein
MLMNLQQYEYLLKPTELYILNCLNYMVCEYLNKAVTLMLYHHLSVQNIKLDINYIYMSYTNL